MILTFAHTSCSQCGQPGHVSAECTEAPSADAGAGGYGGASSGQCYRCGQNGHISRNCPQAGAGGFQQGGQGGFGGGKTCYNCGYVRRSPVPLDCLLISPCSGFGHISSACPSGRAAGGPGGFSAGGRQNVCYNCQQPGHRASECQNERVERPPMKCYNCNEEGHASRDCTQARVGGAFGADKKCYVSPVGV
jgi:hypothetical protein